MRIQHSRIQSFVSALFFGVLLVLSAISSPREARAQDCTFEVAGNLLVRSQLDTSLADQALVNVEIEVKGRKPGLSWKKWGVTRTDNSGYFYVSEDKSGTACTNGREIRVRVRFRDGDLAIRRDAIGDAPWWTIGKRSQGDCTTCDFGDLVFDESESHDRSNDNARMHAEIWMFYKMVMAHLEAMGDDFAISEKFHVVYPYATSKASYVGPLTDTIHLKRKSKLGTGKYRKLKTLIHELGHVWAFQHGRNEAIMRRYFLGHRLDTHGVVARTAVAFHEGFAEYFAQQVIKELSSSLHSYQLWANDKPSLFEYGVREHGHACDHHGLGSIDCAEKGWTSILTGLSMGHWSDDLLDFDYLEVGDAYDEDDPWVDPISLGEDRSICPIDRPALSLQDVLRVFGSETDAGAEDIHTDDMNLDDFLARAVSILPNFDEAQASAYRLLVDVNVDQQAQPWDVFCDGLYLDQAVVSQDFEPADEGPLSTTKGSASLGSSLLWGEVSVDLVNSSYAALPTVAVAMGSATELDLADTVAVHSPDPGARVSVPFPVWARKNENGSFPLTGFYFYLEEEVSSGTYLSVGSDLQVAAHMSVGERISAMMGDYLPVYVSCEVENIGNAPTGIASTLQISIGDAIVNESIEALEPGEEASHLQRFLVPVTPLSTEILHGVCEIDLDDQLDELNESNNRDVDHYDLDDTPDLELTHFEIESAAAQLVEESLDFAYYLDGTRDESLRELIDDTSAVLFREFAEDRVIWETEEQPYDLVEGYLSSPEFVEAAIRYLDDSITEMDFIELLARDLTRYAANRALFF